MKRSNKGRIQLESERSVPMKKISREISEKLTVDRVYDLAHGALPESESDSASARTGVTPVYPAHPFNGTWGSSLPHPVLPIL